MSKYATILVSENETLFVWNDTTSTHLDNTQEKNMIGVITVGRRDIQTNMRKHKS